MSSFSSELLRNTGGNLAFKIYSNLAPSWKAGTTTEPRVMVIGCKSSKSLTFSVIYMPCFSTPPAIEPASLAFLDQSVHANTVSFFRLDAEVSTLITSSPSSSSTSITLVPLSPTEQVFTGCFDSFSSSRTSQASRLLALESLLALWRNHSSHLLNRIFHAFFLSLALRTCRFGHLKSKWLRGIANILIVGNGRVKKLHGRAGYSGFPCSKMTQ